MNKYKVIITKWKSEIVEADGIENYSAEDKVILWRRSSCDGQRDVATFNLHNIIGVYQIEGE